LRTPSIITTYQPTDGARFKWPQRFKYATIRKIYASAYKAPLITTLRFQLRAVCIPATKGASILRLRQTQRSTNGCLSNAT